MIAQLIVFEDYIRRVLAVGLEDDTRIAVRDGNKGEEQGGSLSLFNSIREGLKNSAATPNIVIEVDGKATLVIDAKYKAAPAIPDRNDINQVIVYGARYGARRVMVLHAGRPADRDRAELCGSLGDYEVYNGMVDLNATQIESEEAAFVDSVRALL